MSEIIPLITTTLGIKPELAPKVMWGLTTGEYERVGGIIRRASDKRIVAWLRNVTEGQLETLPNRLGLLMELSSATSLLNLSITAIGFAMVMRRLDVIESKLGTISQVLQQVNRKLDLSFYANFRAAIELARSAFAMREEANRRTSAAQAISRFLEAEHHYLGLLDMELENGSWAVSPFLSTLILAYVTVARCYLELGEVETASCHLKESCETLSPRVQQFYTSVIDVNPALYLHPALRNSISLERVTQILRYQDPNLDEAAAFEKLRQPLWETASQNPNWWLKKLPASIWNQEIDGEKKTGLIKRSRSKEEILERLLPRLPEAFTQVEQAIQSTGCVAGFCIELDYLVEHNSSYLDWQRLELPTTTQEDPIVWILPQESELLAAVTNSRTL